jgi:hypothetical protein
VFLVSFQWVPMMLTLCSHNVPNDFSWCSQYVLQVPIVFPNTFRKAPHFYPIW